LVLVVALVPEFGLTGAAISTLVASIANNFLVLFVVRTRLGIRWWDRRYLRWIAPGGLATACGAAALRYAHPSSALELAAVLAAIYVTFGATTMVQGLHDDDRELIVLARKNLGLAA
jgi:O-antigen/teichoic acid export membrane protein